MDNNSLTNTLMTENLQAPWLFVIDTTDYSGNFERELCAYITGHIGDCGCGADMAELFDKETAELDCLDTCFDNVMDEPDEHGCWRPVTIYPTKGKQRDNNSVAISFEKKPNEKQITLMKERAIKFADLPDEFVKEEKRIKKITGFRLIKNTIKRVTEETEV